MKLPLKSKGFTLIELLVVITIITLLIAMLLPALKKGRAAGQSVACKSNLRQVALSVHAYDADNKANSLHPFFNPGQDWSPPLDPYLGAGAPVAGTAKSKAFDCPANPPSRDANGWAGSDYISFMFNLNMRHGNPDGTWHSRDLSQIRKPSSLFLILERSFDLATPIGGLSTTWYQYWYCGLTDDFGAPTPDRAPHFPSTNIAFADGHVEARPWNDYALIFFTAFPGYTPQVVSILEDNYWGASWPGP